MRGHWWRVVVGCLMVVGVLGGVPSAWAAPGDIVRTLHNPGAGGSFGYAVGSADGKVLVGDPLANTTYVFNAQTGLLLHTLQGGAWFGFCVTGAGNNALVGAIYSNEASIHNVDSGQFVRKWSGLGQENFGYSVGALGSNAIVGATNQSGAGEAYLFDSQTGGLLATFNDPNPGAGGCFGYSVAGVGNKVVVGAPYLGSVYLFDSQTGSLLGSLANPNPGSGNYFGYSVAAVGGNIVVGAPWEESGATHAGAAYVFDAAMGSLIQTLTNPNASVGDLFGCRVAGVDGNVLVGAARDDTAGTDAGAAYLFDVGSGDPLLSLYNPAPGEGGHFGGAVAGLGIDIIVGYGTPGSNTVYLFEGVPEPATLLLLALGGLAMLRRRGAARTMCLIFCGASVLLGLCHDSPAQDFDQSTAALSQARTRLAATSVAGYALFAGGANTNQNTYYDTVDIFNANTGLWTTDVLSQARSHLAATSVGQYAIFAGGRISAVPGVDTVDIFDVAAGQWSTATLAQPRMALAATSVGNYALFAGGWTSSSAVDIFNAATGQWSTAALSQGRSRPAATSVGNLAIFAGGYGGNTGFSNVVDIFNADTGLWSTATLSEGRAGLAATSVGNYALFAGGVANHIGNTDIVDIFNAETGQWSTAALSQKRTDLAATSIGDYALFGGGGWGGGLVGSEVVDIFNTRTGQWSTATLAQGRYDLAAASVGKYAIFAGGCGGGGESGVVDIFAIPEPATLSLLALGGLVLLRRRRSASA